MIKRIMSGVCLILLLFPVLAFSAEDVLLDEDALSAKLESAEDYQLLDARSIKAQRLATLPFSTRYQKSTPIKKGLVLIVADNDAEAMKIARSVSAKDCSVFAVKGGAKAWQRVMAKSPSTSSVSTSFVIPKNTCEQGTPIQELKRDKPLQQIQTK